MKLHTQTRREGTVVVVVAVSLTAILAVVALTLDGGLMMDKRRQAQCASDSAALAAANDLYANWFKTPLLYGYKFQGLDPTGSAKNAALAAAAANGYVNGVNGCTVEVYIPPKTGPFAGKPTHTEVIITQTQQRYFSRIFGADNITYGARSVSRGRRGGINNAILVLSPDKKAALNSGGNGNVTVTGSPIQVNSVNAEAMIANGNGFLSADAFLVGGNPGYTVSGTGGGFDGPIVPNSEPIPDPLAYLPAPDPSTMIVRRTNKLNKSGQNELTIQPGVYRGGISVQGGTLILEPGVYYMEGGGFSIGGQGALRGEGVMIYNAPQSTSDKIDISGQGSVILSPMKTGPYQGILFWQDRQSTTPVNISASPGVEFTVTGTFYAASAELKVTGNGTQQTIGAQYISDTLVLGGNGTYFCTWSPDLTPGTREVLLIE